MRVLDLTDEKGQLCGRILGDLGADIVKIEPPGGDSARKRGPFAGDIPDLEHSLPWWFANANKRGITLNIETTEGKELLRELVRKADLLIESFYPGFMGSLDLDYASLSQVNRRIVVTSITPFGKSGPYADHGATDLTLGSMGGWVYLFGDEDRVPVRLYPPQVYYYGCLHAAVGSLFAYYNAELTGEGQHVDVSLQESIVLALMNATETWNLHKVNVHHSGSSQMIGRRPPLTPLRQRRIFRCKDGFVAVLFGGGAFAGLTKSTKELVKLANEEGFALELKDFDWKKQYDLAQISQQEVVSIEEKIGEFLVTKTKAELLKESLERKILVCPVCSIEDVAENPQLIARQFWVKAEHPHYKNSLVTYPGFPLKLGDLSWRLRRQAPLIGEHNEEIYMELLGLKGDDLSLLSSYGVI
jgi:crotonobetainyl-CoA:carnitine CoA-transferase CaiB-like acyl-CoA transferase